MAPIWMAWNAQIRAYSVCRLQRHNQNEIITLYYYTLYCITRESKRQPSMPGQASLLTVKRVLYRISLI